MSLAGHRKPTPLPKLCTTSGNDLSFFSVLFRFRNKEARSSPMNSNCSPDNLVEEEEEGGVWREGYATRGSGVIAVGEEANPPVVAADGERAGLDGNSGGDALDGVVAVDLEVVVPGCIVGDNGGGTRGPQRVAAAGGGRHGELSLSPTPLARDQPRPFCFAAAGRTRGFSEASGVGNWGFWEPGEGK